MPHSSLRSFIRRSLLLKMLSYATVAVFILQIQGSWSNELDTPLALPAADEECAEIADEIQNCWIYPTPITCERTMASNYSNGDCLDEIVQHAGATCSYEELRHFDKIFQWLKIIVASDVTLCHPDLWPNMSLCWQREWFELFEELVNETNTCRNVFEEIIQPAEGPCRHLVEEYVNLMAPAIQCDEWIVPTLSTESSTDAPQTTRKSDIPSTAHVEKFSLLFSILYSIVLPVLLVSLVT